jgi:hypothetical protein
MSTLRRVATNDGAIPRMGLNIPVPPATKPPPAPVSTKPAAGTKPTK